MNKHLDFVHVTAQTVINDLLIVTYSDGSTKVYDAVKLGCEWFKMDNDTFFSVYGFNFNPHKYGLYERCRRMVYPNG